MKGEREKLSAQGERQERVTANPYYAHSLEGRPVEEWRERMPHAAGHEDE